ncbi:hypothetical protein PsorP6_010768 [Peronosclerospora sorghi]|uniref:Uncharacterized protein n=1 Tax=Peronosclerospora sorghi TaxID=230839 RepID=A0ACC0VX52_9STRA|nr:hypothetical protein PsorP6_010768 [Peronosclerospora sorghi]
MTTTMVYERKHSADASNTQNSTVECSRRNRHIEIRSRLAPQIYLGYIATPRTGPRLSNATEMVVKCAGELQQDGASGRFKGPWNEWQAARQLRSIGRSHPNVVRVFDTFVQHLQVFIVMEHCARGDLLTDLIRTHSENHMDERHALRVVLHVARGLDFLHETCNMAHRDVSLENVFVTHDGMYKLGDFGLSTKANTKTSDFVGKAQYMAPEVAAQLSYSPVVADVWSLGILLFMLLTGAPLLELASPTRQEFETVRAMSCCGVLKSWGMDSQLSAATMDLLSKMLEFDPTKRLQSMAQVLNHSALRGL